jgi:hypothetical protein
MRDSDGFVLCHHGRPIRCLECGDEYEAELSRGVDGGPLAPPEADKPANTDSSSPASSPPEPHKEGCARRESMRGNDSLDPCDCRSKPSPDPTCAHGTTFDVHCCACRRSGFFPPEDCDCFTDTATIDRIVQRVSELPDRTSPDDWPEAMMVTATELRQILADEWPASSPPERSEGWQPIETAPKDGTRVDLCAKAWLPAFDRFESRRFPDCVWMKGDPMCNRSPYWLNLDKDWYPTHWIPLPALPPEPSNG